MRLSTAPRRTTCSTSPDATKPRSGVRTARKPCAMPSVKRTATGSAAAGCAQSAAASTAPNAALRRGDAFPRPHVGKQAAEFAFHHAVALAGARFEPCSLQYGEVTAATLDDAGLLQPAGGLGDAFAAHAQHAGDHFLRHDHLAGGHAIKRHQQPAAKLLLHR